MSGHETIRVLEVEVDASLPSSVPDGKAEGKAEEGVAQALEQPIKACSTQDSPIMPPSTGGVGKFLNGNWYIISYTELTVFI